MTAALVLAVTATLAVAAATPAFANPTAASANDLCAPTADPCIVDKTWDVTGPLDFGLRKLQVDKAGRLLGKPDVVISAGEIQVDAGNTANASIAGDPGEGGEVRLTSYRACSSDPTLRCLTSRDCNELGTCSAVSSGRILSNGMITANGWYGGYLTIRAVGDIELQKRISASATNAGGDGGDIEVESIDGSVTTSGELHASSELGSDDYYTGQGGRVGLTAAADLHVSALIRGFGEGDGGQVDLEAGHDVVLSSDIVGNAGGGHYSYGGDIELTAGNDLSVLTEAGGDRTQVINTDGGGAFVFEYGGYGQWRSGGGGLQGLYAGKDISLGTDSTLRSQGGPGAAGGYIYLYSEEGDIQLDGTILAQGTPPLQSGEGGAAGGVVNIEAGDGGSDSMSSGAVIDLSSLEGLGVVRLGADRALRLGGAINVRGLQTQASGYYEAYSWSGTIDINDYRPSDVTISGKLRGGGAQASEAWDIDACRLHLTPTAVLDQAFAIDKPGAANIGISVRESMVADEGSRIEAAGEAGSQIVIGYRDSRKPPVLNGTIDPAPSFTGVAGYRDCAVCANGEIDYLETCDDGNTASGDGCSAECQDEGCLAESPGYPGTPLCDDGVACSMDSCDTVRHICIHSQSCDADVACTIDACTNDGCTHTASDARCDDHNDCTFDLCNEATGCVYADQTAIECEDGNFCTPPGTCDHGACTAQAGKLTTENAIKARDRSGSGNDRLKAHLQIDAKHFDADPTVTGAHLMLGDSVDHKIADVALPAEKWRRTADGLGFRYLDAGADPDSIEDDDIVTLAPDDNLPVVRTVVRLRSAELSGSMNQQKMSLSLLFGEPAPGDECVTARHLPCEQKGSIATCRD